MRRCFTPGGDVLLRIESVVDTVHARGSRHQLHQSLGAHRRQGLMSEGALGMDDRAHHRLIDIVEARRSGNLILVCGDVQAGVGPVNLRIDLAGRAGIGADDPGGDTARLDVGVDRDAVAVDILVDVLARRVCRLGGKDQGEGGQQQS
jgi:hypothetical protein